MYGDKWIKIYKVIGYNKLLNQKMIQVLFLNKKN